MQRLNTSDPTLPAQLLRQEHRKLRLCGLKEGGGGGGRGEGGEGERKREKGEREHRKLRVCVWVYSDTQGVCLRVFARLRVSGCRRHLVLHSLSHMH